MSRYTMGFLVLFAWATGSVAAAAPHQHGRAELDVAIEGPTLTLEFRSPLDNLLGFEHAPRTAAQKSAADALLRGLRSNDAVLVPAAAARCERTSVTVEAPVLTAAPARKTGAGPAAEAHADLEVRYVFHCARPDLLSSVEVKLFERYRGLRRIEAHIVGPRGQSSVVLSPARRVASWRP